MLLLLGLIIWVRRRDSVVLSSEASWFGVDGRLARTGWRCAFSEWGTVDSENRSVLTKPANIAIKLIRGASAAGELGYCRLSMVYRLRKSVNIMKKRTGYIPKED